MADDTLADCRSASILTSRLDKVSPRPLAISRKLFQNASSRLTLVLLLPSTTERFLFADCMARLPRRAGNLHLILHVEYVPKWIRLRRPCKIVVMIPQPFDPLC